MGCCRLLDREQLGENQRGENWDLKKRNSSHFEKGWHEGHDVGASNTGTSEFFWREALAEKSGALSHSGEGAFSIQKEGVFGWS